MSKIASFFWLNLNRALNVFRYQAIDPVRYHVSDKYRLVYIENPKVACTSIKSVIYPDLAHRDVDLHLGADRCSVLDVKKIKDGGYCFFTVVRNPYDRALSCYADKIERRAETGDVLGFRFYRMIYRLYGSSYGQMVASMGGFLETVSRLPDWLCDRHIKSQVCLLEKIEKHGIEYKILKFENIENDWAEMREELSLPGLPQKNASPLKGAALVAGSPLKLTDRDRSLIAKRYFEDFIRFEYSRE